MHLVVLPSLLSCLALMGGGGGNARPAAALAISVTISPSSPTIIDQGQTLNLTATVASDSSNSGVSWSVVGVGCVGAGCGSFTNVTPVSATYNAPPVVSPNLTVRVAATSVTDRTKSATVTITITPAPIISTTTLANATVGAPYSTTLQATGGAGALTWGLAAGALPSGLSLSSSGNIYGMPSATGTSTITVQVTDSSGSQSGKATARQSLILRVVGPLSSTPE